MNLTFDLTDLYGSVKALKPLAGSASIKPVLQHVLIQGTGREARLRATNLDLDLTVTIPATGQDTFLIPFAALERWVTKKRKGTLTLTHETPEQTLISFRPERKAPHHIYKTECLDPAEYPVKPKGGDWALLADPVAFWAGLAGAGKAVSNEAGRYALNGIFLEREGIRATDGRRLFCADLPLPMKEDEWFLLPVSSILFKEYTGDTAMCITGSRGASHTIGLRVDNLEIWAHEVEGTFPHYKSVLESVAPKIELSFSDPKELIENINLLDASDDDTTMVIKPVPGGAQFKVWAGGRDISSFTDLSVDVAALDGNEIPADFKVMVDRRYFCDALKLELSFLGVTDNQAVLEFSGRDGQRYLLMPITR